MVKPLAGMSRDELEAELSAFRARDEEQAATYDAVLEMIEHPPAPSPTLVKIMKMARERVAQNPPVIASCEVCPHGNAAEGSQLYCFHPSASRETDGNPRRVKRAVPPSWCPWRGQP